MVGALPKNAFAYLEEQQLGHDKRTDVVVDAAHQTNDSLLQQARENVIGPFTATRLLHNDRHQSEQIVP